MQGFLYTPRPGQPEMMEAAAATASSGGHLVVESATGTGKTVAVLAALRQVAADDGRRIIWATRTNSQQEQVVREHAALAEAGSDAGLLVPFMGRRHYCPLLRSDERFRDGTPQELGRLCRAAKRKAQQAHDTGKAVEGACPYYARLLEDGPGPVEALLCGGLDGGRLAERVEGAGSCPYEALKLLLPQADIVVVPLVFLLDDALRAALLGWLGTGSDDVHLVVDEAHHLPDAARRHHTPRLSHHSLVRAQKEAIEQNDPTLAGVTLATSFVDTVLRVMHALAAEHVRDGEDGLVPPGIFEEELMRALGAPSPVLRRIATELETWGQEIRDQRQRQGRLPRSYLGNLGGILLTWLNELDGDRINIVTGDDNASIERYLLHPAPVLSWLHEFWSTLHMSGTLAPLSEHVVLCGLPETTACKSITSPFLARQLRTVCVEGLHRRYAAMRDDPDATARQQDWARRFLATQNGRCGLFFPSHDMLHDYVEEGFLHGIERPVFTEHVGMSQRELTQLVHSFRTDRRPGALLLGVLGGRLTEGIDFPGDAMETALLFGVPYPRPSARNQALIHYYDRVAGRGWDVAVHTPVGRTMRQAIGRLVRGPDDRGTAVILDERAIRFAAALPGIRMVQEPHQVDHEPPEGYRSADLLATPEPLRETPGTK